MIRPSCSARTIPLSFFGYGHGQEEQSSLMLPHCKQPSAFIDKSADVLTRNLYSVNTQTYEGLKDNHKSMKDISELNQKENNYLNPTYNLVNKVQIPNNINYRLFQFQKEKVFSREIPHIYDIEKGRALSKEDFLQEKRQGRNVKHSGSCIQFGNSHDNGKGNSIGNSTVNNLIVNNEENNTNSILNKIESNTINLKKQVIEPNYLRRTERKHHPIKKSTRSSYKSSKDAPQWMKIKPKQINKENNNDTIAIFSRFNQWITMSPQSKSRNQAFEKQKPSIENQTKIRPRWMHSTYCDYNSKINNPFIKLPYTDIHTKKGALRTMLVDKENINQQHTKSIFSYGDNRHNVPFAEDVEQYEKGISRLPKQFFH